MKILITETIDEKAIDVLRSKHDVELKELGPNELLEVIASYDAIVVRSKTMVTKDVIERGKKLKVIGRAGVGLDNIDIEYATKKKIPVVFSPTGSTLSVAELAMGHMISLARHLHQADRSVREGRWERRKFLGVELNGKVLGLVGAGRIGRALAERVSSFGMSTIAFDPYLPKEVATNAGIELVDLEELLRRSDFVSIHAMLTPETRGMIGKSELQLMKETAYLINCARGKIVDEEALYEALQKGWIAGAALDVFENEPPLDSPLLQLTNTSFTPHLGASTVEGQRKSGAMVAEQVLKSLAGEKADYVANISVYE